MQLVPKIGVVLNTQGHCKIDKLQACQAIWITRKLVTLKTWEITFLDEENMAMGMSLRDAMMSIKHPANQHFSLFHLINKHWKDCCYIITCLKYAPSLYAHAMIAALLPYLQLTHETCYGCIAMNQLVIIHTVCWGNEWMGSSDLGTLNKMTSQTAGWGLKQTRQQD